MGALPTARAACKRRETQSYILTYKSMSVHTPEDWVVLYVLLYCVVLYFMESCGIVLYGKVHQSIIR